MMLVLFSNNEMFIKSCVLLNVNLTCRREEGLVALPKAPDTPDLKLRTVSGA